MSSTKNDIKRSDKLATQAEVEKDFSFLHMSNFLKEHVKQKREELNVLNKEEEIPHLGYILNLCYVFVLILLFRTVTLLCTLIFL